MIDRPHRRAGRRSYADLPPDFETIDDAKRRWVTLIRQFALREDYPGAAELLATLRGCTKSVPCRSAACPLCNRKFRQRLHRQAQAEIQLRVRVSHGSKGTTTCRLLDVKSGEC